MKKYNVSNVTPETAEKLVKAMKKFPELFAGVDQFGINNSDRIASNLQNAIINPQTTLTTDMDGKMESMCSLSGSVQADRTCTGRIKKAIRDIRNYSQTAAELLDRYMLPASDRRHISGKKLATELEKIGCPVCICILCYADKSQSWQHGARNKFTANSIYYSDHLMNDSELPVCYGYQNTFRFSAENDCSDIVTARNYIRICRKNPGVQFAIWTKNLGILDKACTAENGKPANLIIILSSLYVNKVDKQLYSRYKSIVDYVFTVWTAAGAKKAGVILNCCGSNPNEKRQCKDCMRCYKPGDPDIYRNEILR